MKNLVYFVIAGILILGSAYFMLGALSAPEQEEFEMHDHSMHSHDEDLYLPGSELSDLPDYKLETIEVQDPKSFELSADFVSSKIAGVNTVGYGYNSMIPGPTFRVRQGESFQVDFTNNIDMDTTVHWHGLRHDVKDDGVPGVSQDPVKPGESYSYTVYTPDAGVYWYHPHVREDVQQDSGLYGNIIVVPDDDYFNQVNREEILILDDILLSGGQVVPYGSEHANFAIMGRFGNIMLVNGQRDYELNVDRGEIVRFYITNVANVRPYNLSFGGAKMKLVGSDLGKYETEEYVDSVVIAPAERYIVEVLFEEGEYFLTNKNPTKTYNMGKFVVSENQIATEFDFDLHDNEDISQDIEGFRQYFDKEPDYQLELSIDMPNSFMADHMDSMPCHKMPDGTMMGDCGDDLEVHGIEWEDDMRAMNQESTTEHIKWIIRDVDTGFENMDIDMQASVGDVLKIRIFNDPKSMHPMQHPIHLHGQRFLVISVDGIPVDNLVWKDTVLIENGQDVEILVDVTNPGDWMMHCHIAEHLEAGMMAMFKVT